jgi:hypothetical protein
VTHPNHQVCVAFLTPLPGASRYSTFYAQCRAVCGFYRRFATARELNLARIVDFSGRLRVRIQIKKIPDLGR